MNKEEDIMQLLSDSLKPIAYLLNPKDILKELESNQNNKPLYFDNLIYGMERFKNFEFIERLYASNLTDDYNIIILRHKLNNIYIKIFQKYGNYEKITEKDIKIVNPKTIETIAYE